MEETDLAALCVTEPLGNYIADSIACIFCVVERLSGTYKCVTVCLSVWESANGFEIKHSVGT